MPTQAMSFRQLTSFLLSQVSCAFAYRKPFEIDPIKKDVADYHIPFELWLELKPEEALLIGFKQWDESEDPIYLIPGYLLTLIPAGLKLYSINSETPVKYLSHKDLDNDLRYGVLAYGLKLKGKSDEQ